MDYNSLYLKLLLKKYFKNFYYFLERILKWFDKLSLEVKQEILSDTNLNDLIYQNLDNLKAFSMEELQPLIEALKCGNFLFI